MAEPRLTLRVRIGRFILDTHCAIVGHDWRTGHPVFRDACMRCGTVRPTLEPGEQHG